MSLLDEKLQEIARQISKGVTPSKVTVRKLLEWTGASRRGTWVNHSIRRALERAGLSAKPDFEWAYIDESTVFLAVGSDADKKDTITTYRIGALESANRKPVSVKPDSPLTEAFTIMLNNDYSQLPVMTTEREVKGGITWKSIAGRLLAAVRPDVVRDFIEPAQVISSETSLFDAIGLISRHEYVIVHAADRTICGIVTATDLSQQLKSLAEPFMLVGECESLLRGLVHGKYSREQLATAKDPTDTNRVIDGVADLTLGEYVRLIENPENWSSLRLRSVDRGTFVGYLKRTRDIRNDVMHFDPDGLDPEAIQDLSSFVKLLKQLRSLNFF